MTALHPSGTGICVSFASECLIACNLKSKAPKITMVGDTASLVIVEGNIFSSKEQECTHLMLECWKKQCA